MNATIREPAVAGTFYPASPRALAADVDAMLGPARDDARFLRLLIVPHAGYVYSGRIAAEGYALARLPPLIVVLAPNHYGTGAPLALPLRGAWRTPLGDVAIDEDAARAIAARDAHLRDDWRAHARDHALEVQLPFVQRLAAAQGAAPRVVTLSCGTLDLSRLLSAGEAIAAALRELGRDAESDVLLVVSSDMSHYVPARRARALDMPALELACAIEPERLHAEVLGKGISMCGIAPAVAGLTAARALGATSGRLVRYGHSGEVTGDDESVVAYATVAVP